jgi:hypothetical protein
MVSGQWSVVSGQWSVVSGQWSEWSGLRGRWSAARIYEQVRNGYWRKDPGLNKRSQRARLVVASRLRQAPAHFSDHHPVAPSPCHLVALSRSWGAPPYPNKRNVASWHLGFLRSWVKKEVFLREVPNLIWHPGLLARA